MALFLYPFIACVDCFWFFRAGATHCSSVGSVGNEVSFVFEGG